MLKIHYSLDSGLNESITPIDAPKVLNIQKRNLVLQAKKGQSVRRGEILAKHPSPFGGAYHAAASGKVTAINEHNLTISCDGGDETIDAVDVRSMGVGKDLLRTLQDLGIDVAPYSGKAETLVINGLNPEPGISVAQQLLMDESEIIQAGLDMARKLLTPGRTVLAVGKGERFKLSGAETVGIKPKYPRSLDALVVRDITGREFPADTKIVSVMDLHDLGRVVLTGLPVMDTVLTIDGRNYRVPLGTPIRHLLDTVGIQPSSGDIVVLGGPFRGEAVYSLDEGVTKNDYGLFIIPSSRFPKVQDAPCINCGECVLNCPARVQPHLISRCAEYDKFEMAEKHGLHSCFECGLCAFHCFARRPLLQYIRFAKAQLKASRQTEQA